MTNALALIIVGIAEQPRSKATRNIPVKIEVTSILAEKATAVLLDPEVSAAQAIAQGAIPKDVGLVVAVESTGYTGDVTARYAQIIPGWSVEKAKRMAPR
jgi:tagatose 1,6-diphosphate aldolase